MEIEVNSSHISIKNKISPKLRDYRTKFLETQRNFNKFQEDYILFQNKQNLFVQNVKKRKIFFLLKYCF